MNNYEKDLNTGLAGAYSIRFVFIFVPGKLARNIREFYPPSFVINIRA